MKLYAVKNDHRTIGIFADPAKAIAMADGIEPKIDETGFPVQTIIVVYQVESDWS